MWFGYTPQVPLRSTENASGDDARIAKERVVSQKFSNFRVEASRRRQVHRVFRIFSGTMMVAVLGLAWLSIQTQPAAAQQPAAQQPAAQQPAAQEPAQGKGPQWK